MAETEKSGVPTSSGQNKSARKNAGQFVAGDARINRTKPGPGRPTKRFKAWCRRAIANPRTKKQVRKILQNSNHPAFKAMWAEVAAHAHGRPAQAVALDARVTTLEDLLDAASADEAE